MNEWIRRSIELANSPGYLDNLSAVYDMKINLERPLPLKIVPVVKKAFDERNHNELVRLLMEYADVFPVKDSYIGFLREKASAIDENPLTVKRIAERLYSLGFDSMLREASRPIETNRQLGGSFKAWIPKIGFPVVDEQRFTDSKKGVLILEGGDNACKNFANRVLDCDLKKGIDIIFKSDEDYYLGEAKFLTTPGGEQDRGFDDAEKFIHNSTDNATRIAIIDGYAWLKTKKGLHDKIVKIDDNIFSALLLKDFIKSL